MADKKTLMKVVLGVLLALFLTVTVARAAELVGDALYWDTATDRLGVGVVSPQYAVDVTGDVNVTGSFRVNGTPLSSGTTIGYTLSVQALTSSPADGGVVYFGNLPKAPVTVAATSKVYIPKTGTIKRADLYVYSGTAGTAESWGLYVMKNNTTQFLVASTTLATSERVFASSTMNIAVTAGDYIEIKGIQPTWVTNPLTTIYGGTLYIE